MKKRPLELSVSTQLPPRYNSAISKSIYKTLLDHLKRDRSVASARLQVSLTRFESNGVFAKATLVIRGTLNGVRINKTFSRQRRLTAPGATGLAGLAGQLAVIAVSNAVNAMLNNDPATRKKLECLDECLADVMLLTDKSLGRRKSTFAQLWSVAFWIRWVSIPIVFLVALLLTGVNFQEKDAILCVILACFTTLFCFGWQYLLLLTVLPTAFLRNDPRGKKTMARAGFKSVWGMRILAMILGIPALVAFVFLILTCSTVRKPADKNTKLFGTELQNVLSLGCSNNGFGPNLSTCQRAKTNKICQEPF